MLKTIIDSDLASLVATVHSSIAKYKYRLRGNHQNCKSRKNLSKDFMVLEGSRVVEAGHDGPHGHNNCLINVFLFAISDQFRLLTNDDANRIATLFRKETLREIFSRDLLSGIVSDEELDGDKSLPDTVIELLCQKIGVNILQVIQVRGSKPFATFSGGCGKFTMGVFGNGRHFQIIEFKHDGDKEATFLKEDFDGELYVRSLQDDFAVKLEPCLFSVGDVVKYDDMRFTVMELIYSEKETFTVDRFGRERRKKRKYNDQTIMICLELKIRRIADVGSLTEEDVGESLFFVKLDEVERSE